MLSANVMPSPSTRPLFRGYFHLIGAMLSPFAIVWFILASDSPRAVVGSAIFGASFLLVYSMSAEPSYTQMERDFADWTTPQSTYLHSRHIIRHSRLIALSDAWGIPVLSAVWGLGW